MSESAEIVANVDTNVSPITNPLQLIEVALKHGAVDQLEKLMQLQQDWEAKEARKEFFGALADFQMNCPVIPKDKQVSFLNSKNQLVEYNYSSIENIVENIKLILGSSGLSYRFEQGLTEHGAVWVRCIITHENGHSEHCTMQGPSDTGMAKNALQSLASTNTYLKRYSLSNALGVVTADSDIDGELPMVEPAIDPEIEKIEKSINNAKTPAGLKKAGAKIAKLDEGRSKEHLKQVYFLRQGEIKKG